MAICYERSVRIFLGKKFYIGSWLLNLKSVDPLLDEDEYFYWNDEFDVLLPFKSDSIIDWNASNSKFSLKMTGALFFCY